MKERRDRAIESEAKRGREKKRYGKREERGERERESGSEREWRGEERERERGWRCVKYFSGFFQCVKYFSARPALCMGVPVPPLHGSFLRPSADLFLIVGRRLKSARRRQETGHHFCLVIITFRPSVELLQSDAALKLFCNENLHESCKDKWVRVFCVC